jgi:GNAT superfamily N-acetyltransferase
VRLRSLATGGPDLRAFLEQHGSAMVARGGELPDPLTRPAVIAEQGARLIGALSYDVRDISCEILTLHTDRRWSGVGTALVVDVARLAAAMGCTRYWVSTTNDNVDALRFYQRRGFRLAALRCGAVDEARRTVKPGIPLEGEYGIPLRDEIELVQELPLGSSVGSWSPPRRGTGGLCGWDDRRSPSPHGRQEGRVAPGQIANAFLIARGSVELLAELKVIAVVDDGPQHRVAGVAKQLRGGTEGGVALDPDLAEEVRGQRFIGDLPGPPDDGGQDVVELGEVRGAQRPGMVGAVIAAVAVAVVAVAGVTAEQRTQPA